MTPEQEEKLEKFCTSARKHLQNLRDSLIAENDAVIWPAEYEETIARAEPA